MPKLFAEDKGAGQMEQGWNLETSEKHLYS